MIIIGKENIVTSHVRQAHEIQLFKANANISCKNKVHNHCVLLLTWRKRIVTTPNLM